jgi:predicted small metal-binding protein
MRNIDCECGEVVQAANDDELVAHLREHVRQEHPDQELDEDEARRLVAERGYAAMDA